jgi:hypothetical protein
MIDNLEKIKIMKSLEGKVVDVRIHRDCSYHPMMLAGPFDKFDEKNTGFVTFYFVHSIAEKINGDKRINCLYTSARNIGIDIYEDKKFTLYNLDIDTPSIKISDSHPYVTIRFTKKNTNKILKLWKNKKI